MKRPCPKRIGTSVLMGVLALAAGGCPPPPGPIRLDPVPLHEAAWIVNRNIEKIGGTLKATGSVDGTYTLRDGRRRSYHVDGTLFCLTPVFFRFDLKKFGERQMLFGSNDEQCWVYTKEDDSYFCSRQGVAEDLPPGMSARPDQIFDALGLTLIPHFDGGGHVQLVQRVVDDYQQVLFLVYNDGGSLTLAKEYWLDRYPPQLIRRVIFRNRDGVVEMQSELDDYKLLSPGGPWLPHVMAADWPKAGARMRFHVRRWKLTTQVSPNSVQFATPEECAQP